MSKHTPGPWKVMGNGAFLLVYGPSGERVCKIIDSYKDAYIIAAAPDMLAALERYVSTGLPYDVAERVIAKAKGGA